MTPNDIDVLIHYHTSPGLHPRHDAPAVFEACCMFVKDGIFEQRDGEGYSTTPRGCALMEVLCATPYPVEVWVDGSGKVIDL